MTIEEKAKAYDKALALMKDCTPDKDGYVCVRPCDIFSELLESEDERIRKALIEFLQKIDSEVPLGAYHSIQGVSIEEILAWLEKQGEKPTIPKWKYKKDHTPLLRDSLILNKYGCVAKSPSGAIVSDVWVIDYDELAKLPKEELEKQAEKPKWSEEGIKEAQLDYWRSVGGKEWHGVPVQETIAWLERQSEQVVILHKFKVGDWIVSKWGGIYQIKEVMSGSYNLLCTNNAEEINSITQVDNNSRLLCIGDIKKLEKQTEQKWSEEDEIGSDATIELLEYFINYAPEFRRPTIRRSIDWLKSIKKRMEE